MKDIELNTKKKKLLYVLSWIGFISGFGLSFFSLTVITFYLSIYGKVTSNDVEPKKNVLNKTWQKFAYYGGLTSVSIVILLMLIVIFLAIFIV